MISASKQTKAGEARARVVALYLPQFHPVPENDEWWGPGFTEWTNVTKARPLFRAHSQPHLPADLGFYDLRLEETRVNQAKIAEAYGVEAFCYWHYWFGNGRRILERPLQDNLSSRRPDFGYCIGWANETWTGVWHGAPDRILVQQEYPGPEDVEAHFQYLLPCFRDERYFRVNGRPLFHVYRPGNLPSAREFVEQWQALALRYGVGPLYLVAGLGHGYESHVQDGFDSGFYNRLPVSRNLKPSLKSRVGRRIMGHPMVREYSAVPPEFGSAGVDPLSIQPCVVPNWDNTPRAGRKGLVLTGATPDRFRIHVRAALDALEDRPESERILWVKSWNEWAEGNYLEPDLEFGHDRLKALRDELYALSPP